MAERRLFMPAPTAALDRFGEQGHIVKGELRSRVIMTPPVDFDSLDLAWKLHSTKGKTEKGKWFWTGFHTLPLVR
jgi:hypothetical protein